MLAGATFVFLGLFTAYAKGQLMAASAKCLMGYEWTFNTLNQSPCDVAASLAAVCSPTGTYDLDPLESGYVYSGPRTDSATSCKCSTVFYSMLSACGYCQSRNYQNWSDHRFNCSTVFLQSYNQPLPSGVKVPAWAYLNVMQGDRFNVTAAQQRKGTESSRSATPSSTTVPPGSKPNVGAIAGGVAGGVALIIIALITICLIRKRRKTRSTNSQSTLPAPRPNMTSPNVVPPTSDFNSFDRGPVVDSPMWRQQPPLATHYTGSSGWQTVHPQHPQRMVSHSDMSSTQYSVVPQNDMSTQYSVAPQNADISSTQYSVAPQNANTMFNPYETNTVAPTRMHSVQSSTPHQIRDAALPGQYASQNMIPAPPRQNSTQNVIPTLSRQNLRQSEVSTSTEQSSTQDMSSSQPSQKMRLITTPVVEEMPPPQYTAEPF